MNQFSGKKCMPFKEMNRNPWKLAAANVFSSYVHSADLPPSIISMHPVTPTQTSSKIKVNGHYCYPNVVNTTGINRIVNRENNPSHGTFTVTCETSRLPLLESWGA